MAVVVWITENTWQAAVDAARSYAERGSDIILVHVRADDIALSVRGAYAGLLGRGRTDRDPGREVEILSVQAAHALLERARERLGHPAALRELHGRVEREVVQAAEGAELLVCVRDGDRSRLGPHSLGTATRFVVDHAPCPLLLVWPERAPGLTSIPAPPD